MLDGGIGGLRESAYYAIKELIWELCQNARLHDWLEGESV